MPKKRIKGTNFEGIYGQTANPLRQIFMMGVVWLLAEENKTKNLSILEIGSWSGSSALTWGDALEIYTGGRGNLTCVDAWQPYFHPKAISDDVGRQINKALAGEEPYLVFKQNIKFLPNKVKLKILRGWSQDILPGLQKKSFDLVYIDGDHSYQTVSLDIENSLELVCDGGFICGDDLEIQAHHLDTDPVTINASLDKQYDNKKDIIYHPGVTLAVKENFGPVSSWYGFWAMQKKGEEWHKVSLDGMPIHIPRNISGKNLVGLKALLMKSGLL